jgi:hypothetical protein
MFKALLGLVALVVAPIGLAQPVDAPASSASTPDAATKAAAVAPVLGVIKARTGSADQLSDFCSLDSSKNLPGRAIVVVVRKAPCVSRYASFSKDLLEVLYAGKARFVPADSVFLSSESSKQFEALEPAQIQASTEDWQLISLLARKAELEKAVKALNATSRHGVALLEASIFDVSEHTDGTGFKATVYNSTKKTIKYVTFTVVGLNAVGDPVRGGFRGSTAAMLRGIGPIEPEEIGTYSKDYMWMTDIVESFRVSNIKVEYTDGSSKVVSEMKNIRIRAEDYEVLTVEVN